MYLTDYERGEPKFAPGDAVVLWSDSQNPRCQKEYGRVIDGRWHDVLACWEYYVAFSGVRKGPALRKSFESKPYVLRYLETSLRRYEGPTQPYGKGSWVLDPAAKKRPTRQSGRSKLLP